jgi:hypothetical protein
MKTTLNQLREHSPCPSGWTKLLKHLGKTEADDEPLSIATIIKSNGIDDALWCLRAVSGHDKELRLYAVWCVRQVQHLLTDPRSLHALDVVERYAHGQATRDELIAAGAAAQNAARDAARDAAHNAAWYAAHNAAGAAAQNAAGGTAWVAARAAALAAQEKELLRVCDCIENGTEPYPYKGELK